jgi:hypothetical protein
VFCWAVPILAGAQPTPSPPVMTSPAETPLPAPSSAPAQGLDGFAQAWAGVTAYSATVAVFEQEDAQVRNVVFDYRFRKPSSVSVHVTAG